MTSRSLVAALAAVLAASAAPAAYAEPALNRIASFAVADNLPDGVEPGAATSAEIIAATDDGNLLVYSDSPLRAIGFIDITDPRMPRADGTVTFEGEPTSVAIAGGKALVAVNTRQSFLEPSGLLAVVDIATKTVGASCDLGGQPTRSRSTRTRRSPRSPSRTSVTKTSMTANSHRCRQATWCCFRSRMERLIAAR